MKSSKIPQNISKMASEPVLEDVESFCLRHEAEKKKAGHQQVLVNFDRPIPILQLLTFINNRTKK